MTDNHLEQRLAESLRRQADAAEARYHTPLTGRLEFATHASRRRSVVRALPAAAGVVLAASVFAIWLANQLPTGGPDVEPSLTASASAGLTSPTSIPSPSATAGARVPVEEFVEVIDTEAPAYAEPDASSRVVDRIAQGRAVWAEFQLDSPEGVWVRVQFASFARGGEELFAWVRGPLPVITLACPPTPDVSALGAMAGQERLRCFGDEELTIVGFAIEVEESTGAYSGTPEWLATSAEYALRGAAEPTADTGLVHMHLDPEAELIVPVGEWVEVVGHFDDPRAGSCERSRLTPEAPEQLESEQTLWCRQRLVVTRIMVVPPPALPTPVPDAP